MRVFVPPSDSRTIDRDSRPAGAIPTVPKIKLPTGIKEKEEKKMAIIRKKVEHVETPINVRMNIAQTKDGRKFVAFKFDNA